MILSVVIPAYNEEGSIEESVRVIRSELVKEAVPFEILVVNDHSKDRTEEILQALKAELPGVTYVNIYRKMLEGYDCVFGSRFMKGGKTYDYPKLKLIINRMANTIVQVSLGLRYNDATNAFKLYRKETIVGLRPFLAHHFNLTLELPLKAIVRGYTFAVLPNSWTNRKTGVSKLKIREMGSRYFFILLYCLIEKFFSRGDYQKKPQIPSRPLLPLGGNQEKLLTHNTPGQG